jgi:BirA family biotin operon repressor/biotin-[acetyl-CoA-carboxylase] ligase
MMQPREEWQLDTTWIGRRVFVFDRVDSTNSLAAELANTADREQLAVLADEQTAGRGQHGRTWTAAPGSSVLLSLLLFPSEAMRRPVVLTAWAAVSVCEAIRQLTGQNATIKWPNDVLVQGRKICGILIEQGRGTVVGIGLNVQQTAAEFARNNLDATALNQIAPKPLATEQVARKLLRVLDAEYGLLCQGQLTTLEVWWQERLGLLGKQVIVECAKAEHRGRLCELGFDAVKLEQPGRPSLLLRPEQVLHIRAGFGACESEEEA